MTQHPNIRRFEGVAAILDVASAHHLDLDRATGRVYPAPGIIIPRTTAEQRLETLLGTSVAALTEPHENFPPFSLNVPRRPVGFIQEAEIKDDRLVIRGGLWCHDFPEVVTAIETGTMGMCLAFVYSKDLCPPDANGIVVLNDLCFLGCSIMLRDACGFSQTSVRLL